MAADSPAVEAGATVIEGQGGEEALRVGEEALRGLLSEALGPTFCVSAVVWSLERL